MIESVYAIKASKYADPFMACPTLEDAIDAACTLHKDMESDERMSMILRLPIFSGVKVIGSASDSSEEVMQ